MAATLKRKLTTILAADAAGFSTAMGRDEMRTVTELRAARDVFARFIDRHGGRIANTAGDGLIADFPSVVEAVQCALEVQADLRTLDRAGRAPLLFRIGIHLGDVIVDGDDLLGDGVNLASRLESMAEPGGVLISQQVYDQVASKLSVAFEYIGERRPKNLVSDVPVYRVRSGAIDDSSPLAMPEPQRPQTARPQQPAPAPPPARDPIAATGPVAPPAPRSLPTATRPFAIAAGGLFAIDLVTGLPFWSQWPILCLALVYGWRAAPQLQRGRLGTGTIRALLAAAFFVGLNLFSPEGGAWSIWPAGAILGLAALLHWRKA